MRRTYVIPVLKALVSEKGFATLAGQRFSPRVERLLDSLYESESEFIAEVLREAIKQHETGGRNLGRWWLLPTLTRKTGWTFRSKTRRTR